MGVVCLKRLCLAKTSPSLSSLARAHWRFGFNGLLCASNAIELLRCRYNYTNGIRGIDAELRLQNDANRFEPTAMDLETAGLPAIVSQDCRKVVADSGGCSTEAVLAGLESGSCSRQELVTLCD